MRRISGRLNINPIRVEDRLKILESPDFFRLYLFEVVCVYVMPELPEEGLIGMVVDVGLRVRDLEIGTWLIKISKEEIADSDRKKKGTCETNRDSGSWSP